MAHHPDDLSIANITVVGPDDHPALPMNIPVGMFKNDASPDAFFPHSPENTYSSYQDEDSSGGNVVSQSMHHHRNSHSGYSTPITPYNVPQFPDLLPLDTQGLAVGQDHGFDQALAGSPLTRGSFSPSTLSPSFGVLSLGSNDAATDAQIFNSSANSKDIPSFGYDTSLGAPNFGEYNVNSDSRSSLSLSIPPAVDNFNCPKDLFQFDEGPFDPNALHAFLNPDTSVQNSNRAQHQGHNRGLSVAGTSWTPAQSPSVTSPSLGFTSSDYNSSNSLSSGGSLLPSTPYHPDDYSVLSENASVRRRHTEGHTRSASRGRSPDPRMGGTSASSSRRTSPYPSTRPSCSPSDTLSPNQVWQQNDHLAVPMTSPTDGLGMGMGGANIPRRHSFNGGSYAHLRGASMPHGHFYTAPPHTAPNLLSFDDQLQQHSASASSSTSSLHTSPSTSGRRVASNAGIKASELRRTKEARFVCETCSQTFTTNHNLKNHVNVHLGVKDHVCSSCKRAFTTQSVLARHLKTCKIAAQQAQT